MATSKTSASPARTAQRTRVLRQFRVVYAAVRQHFHQIERQAGMGGALVAAMDYMAARPGLRVSELAALMDVHQSTASNLVRQLVQKRLVRTERASEDRRTVNLFLEDEGQRVLSAVQGPREGVLPRALAQLPDEALEQLEQGLSRLLQEVAVKADDPAARTPLADL